MVGTIRPACNHVSPSVRSRSPTHATSCSLLGQRYVHPAHLAELLSTLTPRQAVAVERLTGGATHAAAAVAADVSRETVTRWVSHDPGVRAALDSARYAASIETIDRVASIRSRALDVVEQHLDTLDPSDPGTLAVAVTILKVLPSPDPPVRPEPAEALAYRHLEEGERHRMAMREAGPIEEHEWAKSYREEMAGDLPPTNRPTRELTAMADTGEADLTDTALELMATRATLQRRLAALDPPAREATAVADTGDPAA